MGGGLVTQTHPALLQSEFTPDAENMQFSRGGAARRPGLAPFALGAIRGGAIAPVVEEWKGPADDDTSKDVTRHEWGGCVQIPWSHYFDEDHIVIYFNYTPKNIDLFYLNRYSARTVPYRQAIIGIPWVYGYESGGLYYNKHGWRWEIGIAHRTDALFGGSPPSEGDYFFFLRVDHAGLGGSPTAANYIHCSMPVQEGTRYEVRVRMDHLENGKLSYALVTTREDGYQCTTLSGELTQGWDSAVKRPIQIFGPFHPDIPLTDNTTDPNDVPAEGVLERLVIMDGSLVGEENDPLPNLFGMSQRIDTDRFDSDLADAIYGYWPGESDYDGWVKDYGPHKIHGYYVPSRANVRVDERPAVQLDQYSTSVCRAFSFNSTTASGSHTEQDILEKWMGRRVGGGKGSIGDVEFDFIMGGTFKLDGQYPFGWREGRHLVSIFGDDYTASPQVEDPYPWYLEPLFSIYLAPDGQLKALVTVDSGAHLTATASFTGNLADRLVRILVRFHGEWVDVGGGTVGLQVQFDFFINGKMVGTSTVQDSHGYDYHGGPRWITTGPFAGKVYDLQIFGIHDITDPLSWDSSMKPEDLNIPALFNWHKSTPTDLWEWPERSTTSYTNRGIAIVMEGYMKDLSSQDTWEYVFQGSLRGNVNLGSGGFAYPGMPASTPSNIQAMACGRVFVTRILASWRCKKETFFQPKLPTRLVELHRPRSISGGIVYQDYYKEWLTGHSDEYLLESESDVFGGMYVATVHHTKSNEYEHPVCPLVERKWPLFLRSHYDLGAKVVAGELLPAEKDHGVRLLIESGLRDRVLLAGAGRLLFVHEKPWVEDRGLTLFGRDKSYWWGPAGVDMVPQHDSNYSTTSMVFAFRYQRGSRDKKERLIFSIGRAFWQSVAPTQLPHLWVTDDDGQLVIRGRHYSGGVEAGPFEYRVVDIWKTSVANTSSNLLADFKKHWVVLEFDPDASVNKLRVWVDGIEQQVWSTSPLADALPTGVECDVVVFGGNPWALHPHATTMGVYAEAGKGWVEEFYALTGGHTNLGDYGLSLSGAWHGTANSAPLFSGDFRSEVVGDAVAVGRNGATGYVKLRGSDLVPVSSNLPNMNGWRPKVIEYGDEFFVACESGYPRRIWRESPPSCLSSEGWHVDHLGFPLVPLSVVTYELIDSTPPRLAATSGSGRVVVHHDASYTQGLPAGTYNVYITFYDEDTDSHSPMIHMGSGEIDASWTDPTHLWIFGVPRLPYRSGTHTYVWLNDGSGYQLARILTGTDAAQIEVRHIDYPGTTIDFEYGEPPVARTLEMAGGRLVLGGLPSVNDLSFVGSGAGNPYVFPAENYVVTGSADSGPITDMVHVLGRILIVHPRRLSWLTIPGPWAAIRDDQVTGYQGFISVHDPKRLENVVAGMTEEGPAILNETVMRRVGLGIAPSLEGLLSNKWMMTILPSTGEWLFISETEDAFSKAFSLSLGERETWGLWTLPAATAVASAHKNGSSVQLVGIRAGKILYFRDDAGDGILVETVGPETAVLTEVTDGGLFKASPENGSFAEFSPDWGAGLVFVGDGKRAVATSMEGDSHVRWASGKEQYFRFNGDSMDGHTAEVGGVYAYWTSPWLDFGMPTRAKKVSRLWLMFRDAAATLKVLWARAVVREAKMQPMTLAFPASEDGYGEIDMTNGVMPSPLQLIEGRAYGVYFRFKAESKTKKPWWLFKYYIEGELSGKRAE